VEAKKSDELPAEQQLLKAESKVVLGLQKGSLLQIRESVPVTILELDSQHFLFIRYLLDLRQESKQNHI